jgi:hypothetical protein
MIGVGHQYMGVDLHAKTLRKLPQSLQEIFVTTPIPKNRLSLMPTVHHMIPAVRYFQSGMPGHTPPSNQLAVMSNVKIRPFMLYPLNRRQPRFFEFAGPVQLAHKGHHQQKVPVPGHCTDWRFRTLPPEKVMTPARICIDNSEKRRHQVNQASKSCSRSASAGSV